LDEEGASSLPADLRPLAQRMLDLRKEIDGFESPDNFLAMERMFNATVWRVAVPAARLEGPDADDVDVNRQLTRLSLALLQQHPRPYARWLLWNIKHGIIQIAMLLAKDRALLICVVVLLLTHFMNLLRRNRISGVISDQLALTRFTQQHLLFWLALGFAAAKLLLVVLVEPANDRYMTGAVAFVPAAVVCAMADYVGRVWR